MARYLIILSLLFSFIHCAISQKQNGLASFYADKYEGKLTASGEKYKHNKLTAAHKFLPFGTKVKVTNLNNQKSVEVEVNDRGPYVSGRIIDLSRSAAEVLQITSQGLAEVEIEVVDAGDGKVSNSVKQIDRTVDSDTYFEVKVTEQEPQGYGVQIASFQNLDNVLRLTENLKKSYGETPIIEVKDLNGKKVYAMIIGNFSKRKKALKMKVELSGRFPDAFIVTF